MSDFGAGMMDASLRPREVLTRRTPRRYHVGITSVLRRCVAAAFVLPLMTAFPAQAGYAGADVIEAGIETCVTGLKDGQFADGADLYEFTGEEIARLVSSFGMSNTPQAVWTPQDSEWVMIVAHPRQCQIVSFNQDPQRMAEAWDQAFQNQGYGFRAEAASSRQNAKGLWRTSGFAAQPFSGGFIQMTLNAFDVEDAGTLTQVVAVRVGQTPAACKMWPEECT